MSEMNVSALRAMAVGDAADIAFGGVLVPVDYDRNTDEFVVKVRPLETDRIRLVPGARHLRTKDEWRMPATRAQAHALSGVFSGRLDATNAAKDHVTELAHHAHELESLRNAHVTEVERTADHLFDFQQTGVHFLRTAGSALLGDQLGTGKTIQAIEWMRLNAGPWGSSALVVCPTSMKFKWASEVEKFWPLATPIVIDGTAPQRRKQIASAADHQYPVLIINYESLRSHTRLAPWGGKALTEKQKVPGELNSIEWRSVVVDEAHKIKDPSAQQTMAVKQMGLQAEHRLAMTGTPIANSPDDLWSIMNFVAPDEYGSRNQFRNRYCIMTSAWHGGFENMGLKPDTRPEFDQFFLPRFIRRTKSEVLPDLPEKAAIDYRILPLTAKQAKVYKALVEDMMVSIDGDLLMAENPLSLTIRLRQTACGVPVVGEDGNVVELTAPSNKLEAIRDILESDPGEPVVIYADSRKFIELLARELTKDGLRVGLVTGAQGATQRQKAVDAFQAGKLDVILGTLGAGAEGLTLTRARTIILAQQSWAHLTNAQAIDRVHRIGQTRGVQPIVLLSEGTIDLAVALVDLQKEGGLQQLVRDPDWMRAAVRGQVEFPR